MTNVSRRPIRFTSSLARLLFIFASTAALAYSANISPQVPCGLCYGAPEEGPRVIVPLEATLVAIDVKPGLLEAEIDQTFTNRTDTALEAVYLYPLPDKATITHFELRYKDRVIQSTVKERSEAKVTYEQAKAEGKKVALLEQRDPSLFSTAVANFLPGETVHVVLRLIQPLELSIQGSEIRFPMVTTDKYFSTTEAAGAPGNSAPKPPRPAGNAISPGHVYGFDLQVAGFPVEKITSPSHEIRVDTLGIESYGVSLLNEITVPDRDFVLRIETRREGQLQPMVATQKTATGDYGMLTLFPPVTKLKSTAAQVPRDVLFLLDHSGSMGGDRMQSARLGLEHCLSMLRPQDRFQIVVFDDHYRFLEQNWTSATVENVATAREAIQLVNAEGGTELQKALSPCLEQFQEGNRQSILVFLTDGDVGEGASLLNMIDAKIARTRLFAFGIGSAPNASLLRKMAEQGHGQVRFIGNDKDVDPVLVEFFATLDAPVLSDVSAQLLDSQQAAIEATFFPEHLGDVFLGRPLQALYRCVNATPAFLELKGTVDGGPVHYRIPLQMEPLRGEGIEKQFGHDWYQALFDESLQHVTAERREELKAQRLKIALLFQLVTDVTSRVAVEQRVSRAVGAPLKSATVPQANSLGSGAGGDDVIELSPFVLDAADDVGYAATSTLCGSRVRTNLADIASATTVITRRFLNDVAPTRTEDILRYVTEPLTNPVSSNVNHGGATLNGFPFTSIVDPATIEMLQMKSIGFSLNSLAQREAKSTRNASISGKFGTAGTRLATLEAQGTVGGKTGLPVLGILSWGSAGLGERSAYLSTRKQLGESRFVAHVQCREMDHFGTNTSVEASMSHAFSASLNLGVDWGWNRIGRDDPFQFRRNGTTRHHDNLGLFGLDTLTGEVSRLEETFARIQAYDRVQRGSLILDGHAAFSTHEQAADEWLGTAAPTTTKRTTHQVEGGVALKLKQVPAKLSVDASESTVALQHVLGSLSQVRSACLKLALGDEGPLHGYATVERSAQLPWVASGYADRVSNAWIPLAPALEQRHGERLGAKADLWEERLVLDLSVFHETVRDLAFRDWSWEMTHPAPGYTLLKDRRGRASVSYATAGALTREGVALQMDFNPVRPLTLTANGYVDWRNEGPAPGGNQRASFAGAYEFQEGRLKHLSLGLGVSVRNNQYFSDGYVLNGGVRLDFMASYRFQFAGRHWATARFNLQDAGGIDAQPTRYASVRGRECLLSVSQEF